MKNYRWWKYFLMVHILDSDYKSVHRYRGSDECELGGCCSTLEHTQKGCCLTQDLSLHTGLTSCCVENCLEGVVTRGPIERPLWLLELMWWWLWLEAWAVVGFRKF